MQRSIKEFVGICSTTLPLPDPIYEFGSRQMPGQEGYADLRSFFDGRSYTGSDYIAGPGVDVILDLHKLDLPDSSIGTALLIDVLEHVQFPQQAVSELYRVLKPDGVLVVTSVMKFPIHASPYVYWRFTPEGFKTLLQDFPQVFIGFAGDEEFPNEIVAIAAKRQSVKLDSFLQHYRLWQVRWTPRLPTLTKAFRRVIAPFLPPVLTGSNYELWVRRSYPSTSAKTKGFIKLFLPEMFLNLLRKARQ